MKMNFSCWSWQTERPIEGRKEGGRKGVHERGRVREGKKRRKGLLEKIKKANLEIKHTNHKRNEKVCLFLCLNIKTWLKQAASQPAIPFHSQASQCKQKFSTEMLQIHSFIPPYIPAYILVHGIAEWKIIVKTKNTTILLSMFLWNEIIFKLTCTLNLHTHTHTNTRTEGRQTNKQFAKKKIKKYWKHIRQKLSVAQRNLFNYAQWALGS